ncbi:helicase SRCAP [Penaeus vannamei]|uniref:Cuticle protein 6 n=1 Tax=Penaeus vannamei TaxID=6689 RepID=A0A3R7Q3K4_PENVA|nr:skin secretory protein xP2-like [Penaeus vannamei]ROT85143.1 Cuticle protein 6 [Penaeus vannamei]
MNFLTVLCLAAVAASCSGQVPTLPGIFGAFPGLYHGLFTKHPSLLRYGHARSSPGIWQTFIQSAPQGTVAHHGAVATPVTLQSHVPTQVTLKHVSSLPVYFNSLANNQVLLQSPAQTPVTLKVAVPTSAGAAGFGPIVLKATSDSLKIGDPKVVQNLAPTPVSIAPIAPVIYKAETPDEDKDEDTQTVSFRTSVPATFQAVAPAPVTYSVAAPTPVNIEGAVPAPVVQAVPSVHAPLTVAAAAPAQVTYAAAAPAPLTVAAAAPAQVTYAAAAPAPITVAAAAPAQVTYAAAAPAPITVAAAAPAQVTYAAAAPAHVRIAAAEPAPLPVAAAAPVTLNAAPAVAVPGVQSQYHAQDELGQYSFGYYNSQSSRAETRDAAGTVRGAFSYVDPNGQVQTQHYVADSNGFRVAGTNLPVGPGTPVVGRHPHLSPGTPLVYSTLPYTAGTTAAGSTLHVSPGSPLVYSNLPVAFGSPVVAVQDTGDADDADDEE